MTVKNGKTAKKMAAKIPIALLLAALIALTTAFNGYAVGGNFALGGRLRDRILNAGAGLRAAITQSLNAGAASAGPAQPTTLERMYGTLEDSTRGHEAIRARIRGNTLTIEAYVNFKGAYNTLLEGKTYAALARQGMMLWAGSYAGSEYDFEPGMAFDVIVNIHDIYNSIGARESQNYFDFVCLTKTGRSFTFYGVGYYNRELLGTYSGAIPDRSYTNGSIVMHSGINSKYSANQYTKVSAHEFGHVLGLGDAYGKGLASTPECPEGKKHVDGDMMFTSGQVTPNNIEMFLEAYTTGRYQAYVDSGLPEVKSRVIRSY